MDWKKRALGIFLCLALTVQLVTPVGAEAQTAETGGSEVTQQETDTVEAGGTENPGGDVDQGEPGDKDNSENPGGVEDPENPGEGEDPGNPDEGEDPENPDEGEDPENPGEGEDLENPGEGEDLENPGEGEDLESPGEEGDLESPGEGGDPENPGEETGLSPETGGEIPPDEPVLPPQEEEVLPEWYDPEAREYIITDAGMLAELAKLSQTECFSGKTVRLDGDIDAYQAGLPIGSWDSPFTGCFDGGGHTVTFAGGSAWGLFGRLDGAAVLNLRLTGAKVAGGDGAAGVVAQAAVDSSFSSVWVEDAVILEGTAEEEAPVREPAERLNELPENGGDPTGEEETSPEESFPELEGCFAGGFLGFGQNVVFRDCLVTGLDIQSEADLPGVYLGRAEERAEFRNCLAQNCAPRGGAIIGDFDWRSAEIQSVSSYGDESLDNWMLMDVDWQPIGNYSDAQLVYALNANSKAGWGLHEGQPRPLTLAPEGVRACALAITGEGDLSTVRPLVDGAALNMYRGTAAAYGLEGSTVSIEMPKPASLYEAAIFVRLDGEDLEPGEDGRWQYTFTEGKHTLAFRMEITGGYDISWYTQDPEAEYYMLSTVEQLVGLQLLVVGTAPGVEAPVSFAGRTLYLTRSVTLEKGWKPIGGAAVPGESLPFAGTFLGLSGAEAEIPPAADAGGEIGGGEDGGQEELPQPPANLTQIINNSGAALFGLIDGGELAFLENCGSSGAALADVMRNGQVRGCVNRADITAISRYSYSGGLVNSASSTDFQSCFNYGAFQNAGYYGAGGIAASLSGSTLTGCWNFGALSGSNNVGGLAGTMSGGSIQNCGNAGSVSGSSYAGGIVGQMAGGVIADCENLVNVTGSSQNAGGIAGRVSNGASVENCVNKGDVLCASWAGGITGRADTTTEQGAVFLNCSNTGAVSASGSQQAAGIAGQAVKSVFTSCSNSGSVIAPFYASGIAGHSVESVFTSCSNSGAITAPHYAAGIAGYTERCEFTGCTNSGRVTGTSTASNAGAVGGIYGYSKIITVSGCVNTGDVSFSGGTSNTGVGGIGGYNASTSNLSDCRNEGAVTGTNSYASGCFGCTSGTYTSPVTGCENTGTVRGACAAGIVYIRGRSRVEDCVNSGTLAGSRHAGGIAYTTSVFSSELTNCTNRGDVSAPTAGGIINICYDMEISNCRNEGQINGADGAGGIAGSIYDNNGSIVSCLNLGAVTSQVLAGGITSSYSYWYPSPQSVRMCLNLGKVECAGDGVSGEIMAGGMLPEPGEAEGWFCGPDGLKSPADGALLTRLTQEQLTSGEGAWLLGHWGQGEDHPVLPDEDHPPVRRLTLSISGRGSLEGLDGTTYHPQGSAFTFIPKPDADWSLSILEMGGESLLDSGSASEKFTCEMPETDCVLEAVFLSAFMQEFCEVRFQLQYDGLSVVKQIKTGERVPQPPEPVRKGWRFLGWYLQEEGGEPYNFSTRVVEDLTLYAHWRDERYTQLILHGNLGTPELERFQALRGGTVDPAELPAFTREPWMDGDILAATYEFSGWKLADGTDWDYAVPEDAETLELYAQWKMIIQREAIPIHSQKDLEDLAQAVAGGETYFGCRFTLAENVVLDSSWNTPIGRYDVDNPGNSTPFLGEFSGGVLTLEEPAAPLFGYVGEDGLVSGLTVTGSARQMKVLGRMAATYPAPTPEYYAAGLVLWNGGRLEEIRVENLGLGDSEVQRTGGVACWNLPQGRISGCSVDGGEVSGQSVGGIVSINGGTVSGCATGSGTQIQGLGQKSYYYSLRDALTLLPSGGIVGVNYFGVVEDCENQAAVTVTGADLYGVAGGVAGACREDLQNTLMWQDEKALGGTRAGAVLDCVNRGKITVTAQAPIVGGVIGVVNNADADSMRLGGLENQGDIAVSNTILDTQADMNGLCAVGGVIGSCRAYPLFGAQSQISLSGLKHEGVIRVDHVDQVGGILGGTHSVNLLLRDCTAKGSIQAADTAYVGGIFGSHEYNSGKDITYPYMDAAGQDIVLERCAAEMDITATGETLLVGGVAAWHEQNMVRPELRTQPLSIRDCCHLGTISAESGTVHGVCPQLCAIDLCWHSDKQKVEITRSSTVTDLPNGVTEYDTVTLDGKALTSGEAAWLLDGGESLPHLGRWTQGEEHPAWGGPSVYRIKVESGPNGSLTLPGLTEDGCVYGKAGSTLTPAAQPSGEIFELDGKEYHYETGPITLSWLDKEGVEHTVSLTSGKDFGVPEGNGVIQAQFTAVGELIEAPVIPEEPEQPGGPGEGGGGPGGSGTGEGGTGEGSGPEGEGGTGGEAGGEPTGEAPGQQTGETPEEIPEEGLPLAQRPEQLPEELEIPEEPPVLAPAPETPQDIPPASGLDPEGETERQPDGLEKGASGGAAEAPRVLEILPEPLRQPHVLAVACAAAVLVLIGAMWRYWRQRKH